MLSQAVSKELDWKWSTQDSNQLPYRILVLQAKISLHVSLPPNFLKPTTILRTSKSFDTIKYRKISLSWFMSVKLYDLVP